MQDLGNIFRRNLKRRRKERGYSQEHLAALCDVSDLTVGRWERGETWPKPENLSLLAVAFDCRPEDLIADEKTTPSGKSLNVGSIFQTLARHPRLAELMAQVDDDYLESIEHELEVRIEHLTRDKSDRQEA